MINLAIMASGSGTNAEAIIRHFQSHPQIRVVLVMCNKKEAGVYDRARRLGIDARWFSRADMENESFLDVFREYQVDMVILAGFLLRIPPFMIRAFPDRMINIHPALLPNYGGKGMYGHHVHEAVIENGEVESGITIHLVNENYDEGRHLFQARVKVERGETADSLASKIHVLEHRHFPRVIEEYASALFNV